LLDLRYTIHGGVGVGICELGKTSVGYGGITVVRLSRRDLNRRDLNRRDLNRRDLGRRGLRIVSRFFFECFL
jgi:hypothetical protein